MQWAFANDRDAAPGGGRGRRRKAAFLLFIFSFALIGGTLLGSARPANAQYTDPVTSVQTTTTNVFNQIKDAFVEAAVTAVYNGINYFASQLAYTAAVALTTDCGGNIICWNSKTWEKGLTDAWKGALGEMIGTLSEQGGFTALGFNLCQPSLRLSLNIQLGLMNELQPPQPRCNFDQIASNWEAFRDSVTSGQVLEGLKPTFTQGQTPISASLGAFDGALGVKADARLDQMMKRLMDAGAGGFTSVTDQVSGRAKAPPASSLEEYRSSSYMKNLFALQQSGQISAGHVATRAVTGVVINAVSTFTMTLVARLFNRLVNGLLSTEELLAIQPDLILNPEGMLELPSPSEAAATQAQRFSATTPRETGIIDPLLDFSVCPSATNRAPNNCVIDQQLANAVRVADVTPITVRDALEKGFLHGDWPLISAADKVKDQDPFCYTYGYCESNLKKLRAARVISIGWEIAASKSSTTNPVKLKEVVDKFNDCNGAGMMDDSHPFCHLIDPDWVLRIPLTQCRAMAFGNQLIDSSIPSRVEVCVDRQTCLQQNDQGECIGGWGYCARERNVWRFNGDQCPAAYNTCRTLQARTGETKNFVLNTIDHGICNADNAGCLRYATDQTVVSCTKNFCIGGTTPGAPCSTVGAVCGGTGRCGQACAGGNNPGTPCANNAACTGGGICAPAGCPLPGGCTCEIDVGSCTVPKGQDSCTNGATGQVCRLQGTCGTNSGCSCQLKRSCRVPNKQNTCNSIDGSDATEGDDWRTDPALFLNKNARSCDASENGCSAVIKLDPGQSLNLLRNSSFEDDEDGDNNGTPDHPRFWTPFGAVPTDAPGFTVTDAAKAVSGQKAMRVPNGGSIATETCPLGSTCDQILGCPCVKSGGTLDDYSCKVIKGESSCTVTNRVTQVDIIVTKNRTYTVSGTFVPLTGNELSGAFLIGFRDHNGAPVFLNASDVVMTTDFTGGTAETANSCAVLSGGIVFAVKGTKSTESKGIRGSCTFVISKDVAVAHVDIVGGNLPSGPATDAIVDDVQFEEGGGTSYHEGYGSANTSALFVKVPPPYLNCTGEDTENEACKKFAGVCRETEIGCQMYTPTNGEPPVPGVAFPQDRCPAECNGYDVFKQEESEFDAVKFPVYFIPSTAKVCSEADVGCSEFTNIETEQVEYFSKLRYCVGPDDSTKGTYYSWEGSDTTGYQLRVWSLKNTTTPAGVVANVNHQTTCCTNGSCSSCDAPKIADGQASDVCSRRACSLNTAKTCSADSDCLAGEGTCVISCPNAGPAPCTKFDTAAIHCASPAVGNPSTDTLGYCSKKDIDGGNFDCREFYDENGNRHYRLLSRTILASANCSPYRITVTSLADCNKSNGRWDPAKGQCTYFVDATESNRCASGVNNCRAYKGNAATNIRSLFFDGFETGLDAWTDGDDTNASDLEQSSESITVGGHSLKIETAAGVGNRKARREVGGLVAPNRSYTISFWARGSGTLSVGFKNGTTALNCQLDANCPADEPAPGCPCTTGQGLTCYVLPSQASCSIPAVAPSVSPAYPVPATAAPPASMDFADDDEVQGVCVTNGVIGAACVTDATCGAGRCVRTSAPRINLSSEWRQYSLGPVIVAAPPNQSIKTWGTYSVKIQFESRGFCGGATDRPGAACNNNGQCGGGTCNQPSDIFIDNVNFQEVQDNIFVVRDSWNTPAVCDQTLEGIPSPQEMLGCKEYTDSNGEFHYLRTFSRLCRERSVGCSAFSHTQNTPDNPYAETYSAVCKLYVEDSKICLGGAKDGLLCTTTSECGSGGTCVPEPRKCGVVSVRRTATEGLCNTPAGCLKSRSIGGSSYSCTVFNGVGACEVNVAADSGAACVCNYDTRHQVAASTPAVKLSDVCRVAIGESECRFKYEGWDASTKYDEHPDRVLIPPDRRTYLVVNQSAMCSPENIGCKVLGRANETFEGECKNIDDTTGLAETCAAKKCAISGVSCTSDGGCGTNTCNTSKKCSLTGADCETTADCAANNCIAASCSCTTDNNATCQIPFGESSCNASFELGVIDTWDAKAIQDLPSRYDQSLCSEIALGCESYTATDGTYYFKEPFNKTCVYKEGIQVDGQIRAGWFRSSESGGNFACYPELLQNGNYFSMYKNADPVCRRSTPCNTNGGCLCYLPPNPNPVCKIVKGGTACGYQGWVGVCEGQYDRCEEFIDPSQTTATNPEGQPYYYIVNTKLDRQTCAGSASLKQGCVLFNQTSNTADLFSSGTTYFKSIKDAASGRVSPINCDSSPHDPRCENRCFSIPKGVCSGDSNVTCRQDEECSRCSNDSTKVCVDASDCGGSPCVGAGECLGDRKYTIACDGDADCSRQLGERCAAIGRCSNADKYCDVNADCPGGTCQHPPGKKEIPVADAKVVRNDSNIIIKVRPDRECAEWMACKSFSYEFDQNQGKWRGICSGFGLCAEQRQVGQAFECVRSVDPPKKLFTPVDYSKRDTTWSGNEYSGYSVPNTYSMQFLIPVSVVGGRCIDTEGDLETGTGPNGEPWKPCTSSTQCNPPYFCKMFTGLCRAAGPRTGWPCDNSTVCAEGASSGYCSQNFLTTNRFAVQLDPSRSCEDDTGCTKTATGMPEDGSCIAHKCVYNYAWPGAKVDLGDINWAPRCRAYPEADSPFSDTVVMSGGYNDYGIAIDKLQQYAGANVCGRGNDCECSYARFQYGKGGSVVRYFSHPGFSTSEGPISYEGPSSPVKLSTHPSKFKGVCVGGPYEGKPCDPNTGGGAEDAGPCDKLNGGTCQVLSLKSYVQGWQGFCADLDRSININGSPSLYECNLWLPVDQLAGAPDNFNQFEEAGFRPEQSTLQYCQVAQGNARDDGWNGVSDNDTGNIYEYEFYDEAGYIGPKACECKSGVSGSNCEIGSFNDPYDDPDTGNDPGDDNNDTNYQCDAKGYADNEDECLAVALATLGWGGLACWEIVQDNCPRNSESNGCKATDVSQFGEGDAWFDVSWEDERTYWTPANGLGLNWVRKNTTAGFRIRIENGTFFLTRQNEWTNDISWEGNHDVSSGGNSYGCDNTFDVPGDGEAGADGRCYKGSGNSGDCVGILNMNNGGSYGSDHEGRCEDIGGDNNCLAARARWNADGTLAGIETVLCHNASTFSHNVKVHGAWVLLREQCTEVAVTHSESLNPKVKNMAWTDRIYQWSNGTRPAGIPSGYDYTHSTTRAGMTASDITPMGRIEPEIAMPDSATLGKKYLDVKYPITVWDSEGGTKFTIVDAGGDSGVYRKEVPNRKASDDSEVREVGGYPWACIGPCKVSPPALDVDNKGGSASAVGQARLSQLFARAFLLFKWDPSIVDSAGDFKLNGNEGVYVSQDPGWDVRASFVSNTNAPKVVPVVTSNCSGDAADGLCEEGAGPGITVNENTSGIVNGDPGRYRVLLRFYGYADKEHMPIRRKIVDFGDGTVIMTEGYFKNHRGCEAGTDPGECNSSNKICGSEDVWGLVEPQTCESRFFQEVHTYTCTPEMVGSNPAVALPTCGGTDNRYPCKNGNKCVFKPRVQLMDNWGVCNGSCPGALGGSACFNPDGDLDMDGNDAPVPGVPIGGGVEIPVPIDLQYNECTNLQDDRHAPPLVAGQSKTPWTSFSGTIEMTP